VLLTSTNQIVTAADAGKSGREIYVQDPFSFFNTLTYFCYITHDQAFQWSELGPFVDSQALALVRPPPKKTRSPDVLGIIAWYNASSSHIESRLKPVIGRLSPFGDCLSGISGSGRLWECSASGHVLCTHR